MATCALHPGIVVNNEDTADINEDSHRNIEGTTDSLSPSEGLLGHLGQQTADDLERVSVPGTHPVTEPDVATHGVGLRRSKRTLKPSAAGAASKGIPHASMLDRVREEIHASEKRTHEQREVHSTGGDIINQTGNDNINIRDEPDLNNAPDVLCMSDDDPKDVADAMRWQDWPEWQKSMGEELTSLKEHHVWTLILHDQVPPGKWIIPLKFVLQYKLDENGDISRHKSHVIAKGFAQHPGI